MYTVLLPTNNKSALNTFFFFAKNSDFFLRCLLIGGLQTNILQKKKRDNNKENLYIDNLHSSNQCKHFQVEIYAVLVKSLTNENQVQTKVCELCPCDPLVCMNCVCSAITLRDRHVNNNLYEKSSNHVSGKNTYLVWKCIQWL